MNGAGDEFLSRAAFSGDHHAAGLRSDRFDQVEEFAHLRARADNVVEAGKFAKPAAQVAGLFFQGLRFGVLFHCGTKFIEQPIAFNDVAVGAEVHGVNGGVDGWHASDENECCRRRHLFAVAQKLQAVHIRHADIGNHDVEYAGGEPSLGVFAIGRKLDFMPVLAETDLEEFADGAFIVDNEQVGHGLYPLPAEDNDSARGSRRSLREGTRERMARGNSTMNSAPLPFSASTRMRP